MKKGTKVYCPTLDRYGVISSGEKNADVDDVISAGVYRDVKWEGAKLAEPVDLSLLEEADD